MRVTLAGLPFSLSGSSPWTEAERAQLPGLAPPARRGSRRPSFQIERIDEPPWPGADPAHHPDLAPATVDVVGERLRVTHRRFLAEIDPAARRGRLYSPGRDGSGLRVILRLSLAASLPEAGGLPLHAAGVVVDGRGLVFFGISGAGKTTLAAGSPHPVVSDELVVVRGEPPRLFGSGFWGTGGEDGATAGASAPLQALVELRRGPRLRFERIPPEDALARLVPVTQVPPATSLWRPALALLGRLVRSVPVVAMEWTPDEPPWRVLETCPPWYPRDAGGRSA